LLSHGDRIAGHGPTRWPTGFAVIGANLAGFTRLERVVVEDDRDRHATTTREVVDHDRRRVLTQDSNRYGSATHRDNVIAIGPVITPIAVVGQDIANRDRIARRGPRDVTRRDNESQGSGGVIAGRAEDAL
jgi:hypothetical protein